MNNKIPNEAIPDCYKYSKEAFEGKITPEDARLKIHEKHGIKIGSAKDYPKLFKVLISGEGTIWSLSNYCHDYFINRIYIDYGKNQLKKTLKVFMFLIEKYEKQTGSIKKSKRAIYEKYSKLIK
jgi:hypothetical protein